MRELTGILLGESKDRLLSVEDSKDVYRAQGEARALANILNLLTRPVAALDTE